MEKENRENWTVSRTPIETSSTSDLWLVTRIIYPVIVAGTTSRHSLRLTREKHINGDWSSPPSLWNNILVSYLISWKQRESERSSRPLGVNAIKISYITRHRISRKRPECANGFYWDLRIESWGPDTRGDQFQFNHRLLQSSYWFYFF